MSRLSQQVANSITSTTSDDLDARQTDEEQLKSTIFVYDSENYSSAEPQFKSGVKTNVAEKTIEVDEDDFSFIEGDISLMNNSPYPEVREVVPNTDDPTIQINHWRTWTLTTIFVVVFAGVNQFFSLRYPSLTINFLVAQVVAYPAGKFLARVLPDIRFKNSWFNLNPGPYTIKEHGILTICVALTSSTAYAMNILIAQTNFFDRDFGAGYQILLVWTTQCLGYGLAGVSRRFLVDSPAMIWPQTLISVSMFETLHSSKLENAVINGWKISRYYFFLAVFAISFVWYWFPGFLWTGLSYFNFVLWSPETRNNFVVNFIFGVSGGIGAIAITFDYTQISQAMTGSVFATPFWVVANTYASVFIFFIFLLPILYFTNTWDSKYLPVISTSTFDNKQQKYNVTRILQPDFIIDRQKYREYSPLFIPFSYLLSYALNFAAVIGIFIHTYLYHGKEIYGKLKDARHGGEDIHKRLMNQYTEAPDWWYLVLFVITLALSFVTVCNWDTGFPAWGLVIAILISVLNFVPQGLLEGITNQHVGLNIITELVCGYMLPYRPLANVLFKVYGFIVMRQGLELSRDLKLGRYLKIAPRLLFFMQIWSTLIAGLVNVGIQEWMRHNIKDICLTSQPDGFICANGRTIFNASIIWSLPKYLFSPGQRYNAIMYFFLIGAFAPFFTYALHKKWPHRWFGKINAPVFFTGPGNIPPSTPYNYSVYFVASAILTTIKNKWPRWHGKYNFVMGAAVETGVALAVVLIFLCVQFPGGTLEWWGNTVWKDTLDVKGTPFYTLPEGETFGPDKWW
ncbi:Proton-coupled oligopeptide transporter [Komagataella phaffii CBS 7435]|uniref:Proton-coupled oligopeptide transporter of the plasma membrane n=2 Tax=Komagataella phaffii TaxID=460519 RepID=C4R6K9_KOMPG|nr:Proton-coupled oligopeptide transporter of the plasma membrane [Komagataella phaffii GS115]AOA64864.1 GQ67_04313T0 [Komagataella phaffii]CAH2451430.1 Proton-coupled oligopeptide transporter [Komagataella phaffii CBS 7435]AOA70056.1 GQ68_04285T0 [Komagataella phaffii GS115]CAY71234.1 Proton-coupled oligopeptide transporter of the plasma membrane [Komagataella phaffii GS115]CCA41160.1 Proton-coupled oligopeptide transporter [Komagataella phaffii CBS 7435]